MWYSSNIAQTNLFCINPRIRIMRYWSRRLRLIRCNQRFNHPGLRQFPETFQQSYQCSATHLSKHFLRILEQGKSLVSIVIFIRMGCLNKEAIFVLLCKMGNGPNEQLALFQPHFLAKRFRGDIRPEQGHTGPVMDQYDLFWIQTIIHQDMTYPFETAMSRSVPH